MRLDVFLFENGYASSRTEAKQLITESLVSVNGKVITKASYDVEDGAEISISDPGVRYASRGGKKLECAIESFKFDIKGKLAIDVGASSGGFTDCLLKTAQRTLLRWIRVPISSWQAFALMSASRLWRATTPDI